MANWKKIVLLLLVLIAFTPFVLLHLFVLCARIFEPKLESTTVLLPLRPSLPVSFILSQRASCNGQFWLAWL